MKFGPFGVMRTICSGVGIETTLFTYDYVNAENVKSYNPCEITKIVVPNRRTNTT